MTNQLATSQHYSPTALAGLFGWLRRAINTVANVLKAFMPDPVFAVINDFTNGDGQFNFGGIFGGLENSIGGAGAFNKNAFQGTEDLPLTIQDEIKLDKWLAIYTPYITHLFTQLKAYRENNPTIAQLDEIHNRVYNLIGVFDYYGDHVFSVGEGDFSRNALRARKEFLKIQSTTLSDTLEELLLQYKIDVDAAVTQVSVSASTYTGLGFNLPDVFMINTKRFALTHIDDIVVDENDNNDPQVGAIVPDRTDKKINYSKLAFTGIAILIALKLIRNSNN